MNPATRRILIGVAFVVLLLGIGFATYFLGGSEEEKPVRSEPAKVRLAEGADRGGYRIIESLELPWGSGARAVSMSPVEGRSTLDTVFTGPKGRIYVVDHVPGKVGARIRWFENGDLVGVHDAPGGSTLFTPDGDGFMYVLAKGSTDSERVVVADADGSITATYTVPLNVNSGGLVRVADTLYARGYMTQSDPDAKTFNGKDVLVPVAVAGEQASDKTAEEGVVEAWTLLDDGVQVQTRLEGAAQETRELQTRRYLRYGAREDIEIPYQAVLLGATSTQPSMWVLFPPRALDSRGTPGWPALYDAEGLVLRIDPDGKVLSSIPVFMPRIVNPEDMGWTQRLSVNDDRLAVTTGNERGVKILVFGRDGS